MIRAVTLKSFHNLCWLRSCPYWRPRSDRRETAFRRSQRGNSGCRATCPMRSAKGQRPLATTREPPGPDDNRGLSSKARSCINRYGAPARTALVGSAKAPRHPSNPGAFLCGARKRIHPLSHGGGIQTISSSHLGTVSFSIGQQTWLLPRQSRPFQKVFSQFLALDDPILRVRGLGAVNNWLRRGYRCSIARSGPSA
jgi:hypothetical protein